MLGADALAGAALDARARLPVAGVPVVVLLGAVGVAHLVIDVERLHDVVDVHALRAALHAVAAVGAGHAGQRLQGRPSRVDHLVLGRRERHAAAHDGGVLGHHFRRVHAREHGDHVRQRAGEAKRPGGERGAGLGRAQDIGHRIGQLHQRAALHRLHDDHGQPALLAYLIAFARLDDIALPVHVVDLQLHEVHLGVGVQHALKLLGVVVDREAELLDLPLGLLLGAELPQAVLVEGRREGLAQVVQQVIVEVVDAALLKGGVEHGAGVLRKPRRQLRGDGERVARVALHKGLAKGPLRLAAVVAAGRVEIGEPGVHEDVHQLADLVNVDGRGIICVLKRQPHEPEPERSQLPYSLHGTPLFLCARAKITDALIIAG